MSILIEHPWLLFFLLPVFGLSLLRSSRRHIRGLTLAPLTPYVAIGVLSIVWICAELWYVLEGPRGAAFVALMILLNPLWAYAVVALTVDPLVRRVDDD